MKETIVKTFTPVDQNSGNKLSWLVTLLTFSIAAFLIGCGSGANNSSGENVISTPTPTPAPVSVNEWTWVGGSDIANATGNPPPVYGSLGVAAPGNYPGGRMYAGTWTDPSGNLWLFGGESSNDLWKFSPATKLWTWMSGSNSPGAQGVYGTRGVPASTNVPGARENSSTATDANGNLWLFGGNSDPSVAERGSLSELWKYDPSADEWTWVSGSSALNASAVYGTRGVVGTANTPGARSSAVSWIDGAGNIWIFGGIAANVQPSGVLNDLWRYSPAADAWTWVNGSNEANAKSTYGTRGVGSTSNSPGARVGSLAWTDATGNFWLFGGSSEGDYSSDLNDLWEFNPSSGEWTWVSGSNTSGTAVAGIYGVEGVPAATNAPGSRCSSVSGIDPSGNLWLFGGQGYDSTGADNIDLNDLWKFDPIIKQWTWVSGSSAVIPISADAAPGVYGTLGVAAPSNVPGGRDSMAGWVDNSGDFWILGGEKTLSFYDLWEYQP